MKPIDHHLSAENVLIQYEINSAEYVLSIPEEFAYWVKLSDYGTVDTNTDTLNKPLTSFQFTTIENCPMDYFILGDDATQNYAADTFDLGLCMLHLFTGHAPYEELLDEIQCPDVLMESLDGVWKVSGLNQ